MNRERRVALITGSAKGLGKMTALTLAKQGCDIVVNYVRSEREATELADEIRSHGSDCLPVQADISKPEQVQAMVEQIIGHFGQIDILINNAGPFIRERRRFAEYDAEEIDYLLRGNLSGVMQLDHLALPYMRRQRWGRIIHFGFGHAGEARGWTHRAVYAAAKVGLVSFTKTLAEEEAEFGITVNMVCPGDIRGSYKEKTIADVEGITDVESPRGRPGTGEDIARVITFLCDRHSDFVTGNIIDISGGLDPIRPMSALK